MTKPTGKPKGRPRKEIDFVEFEKLCFIQATIEEIAGWFECSISTIQERVAEHYEAEDGKRPTFDMVAAGLRGKGKIGVRRAQFQRAAKGSDKMLIHLGKNYCGQSEKAEVEHTIKGPLVIIRNGKEAEETE